MIRVLTKPHGKVFHTAKHGIDSKLESKSETDYEPHLNSMVNAGCDVITAVGFLMGEATVAEANKDSISQ